MRTFPTSSDKWFLEASVTNTTAHMLWLESIALSVSGVTNGELINEPSDLYKLLKPKEAVLLTFAVDREFLKTKSKSGQQISQPFPGQISLKFRSHFGEIACSEFLTQIPSDVCVPSQLSVKMQCTPDVQVGDCVPVTLDFKNVSEDSLSLGLDLGTGADFIGVGETSLSIEALPSGSSKQATFKVIPLKPGFVNFPPLSLLVKNHHQYIRDMPAPMLVLHASSQSATQS